MSISLTRSFAALALVGGMFLPGCVFSMNQIKAKRTVSATTNASADVDLTIKTRNGDVEVVFDDAMAEIRIDAVLSCVGETQIEADERVAAAKLTVTQDLDRTVTIGPTFPVKARGGDGADITVHMPTSARLTIDTGNGNVVVTGGGGLVFIDTSNGSVTITDFDGPVQADSSNGKMVATNVAAPVKLHTSNGRIELTLADDANGALDLDTSNGKVSVSVGSAFTGRIKMDTSNGTITVIDHAGRVISEDLNKRKNRGTVTIGEDAQADSRIDSSNGNIKVTTGAPAAE